MKKLLIRGVALTAFFLISLFSKSQVVCTDVNPDITNSGNASLDIDLNNDNTADFRITSAQSGFLSFVVVQAGQIGTSNFVLTNSSGGALALSLNAVIGSTSTIWTQMNSTNQQMSIIAGTTITGPWVGATDQYLGLALSVGTNTYYGWARFSFSSTTNQYTFKDYAYQSTAGLKILAGESCASITNPQFTMPDSICAGTTVTVTAQTGTDIPTSYSWAATPGATMSASSSSSTAITFASPGNSVVLLYVTNSTTFGFTSHTVQIKPAPTISISPATTTICAGSTHTLTAISNGSSFSWTTNPPSNLSSTSQSVVVSPTTTTNYLVEATLNGCKASANTMLIVTPLPTTSLVSTFSMCAQGFNNSKDFTGISAIGYTLSGPSGWPLVVTTNTSGGGAVVTTTPPYFTTNTLVTTTLTGMYGPCSVKFQVSFSIIANPTITVASSPSTLCVGNPGTITVSGSTNYAWMSNSQQGAFSIISPSQAAIAPLTNATYSVFGVVSQCSSQIQVINVGVVQGPTLVVSSETTCVGNTATLSASGALGYSWAGPLGPVSTSSSAVINAGSSQGIIVYTITGTGANSCTSKTQATLTIHACTGLLENNRVSLSIYPHPVKEKLFFEAGLNGVAHYMIIDASGRKVKEGNLEITGNHADLGVSELPPGIYMVELSNSHTAIRARFLKVD